MNFFTTKGMKVTVQRMPLSQYILGERLYTKYGISTQYFFMLFVSFVVSLLPTPASAQHPIDIERKVAQGEYYDALVLYETMPKRRLTTSALVAASKSAWALGLPELALGNYQKALRDPSLSDEDRARIQLSRGIIEYQEGHLDVAALFAEKATQLLKNPSSLRSKAWLLWGESLAATNSYAAAEQKYQSALAEATEEEKAETHYLLGSCQKILGKLTDAREHFEAVPIKNERAPEALRALAEISLQNEDYDNANFWLEKGRTEFPEKFLDSWVDYALVKIAGAKGDLAQVAKLREEAAKKYAPSDQWVVLLEGAAEAYAWDKNEAKAQMSEDKNAQ